MATRREQNLPDLSLEKSGTRGVPLTSPSAAMDDIPIPAIPGYQIESRLGEGGMGVVWAGTQLSTKRKVAIKFLSVAATFGSTRGKARFVREVELAASLQHPNIARVYDSGLEKGVWYYAMEHVAGVPLDQYAHAAKLSLVETLRLMLQVCQGMQHAHQRGVIHRDLKPSNILVSADGQAHILDFGLAKDLTHDKTEVTLSGDVSGTPAFMSPEQARGETSAIDTRSDVYSLGVILYLLLTRRMPHPQTDNHVSLIRRIAEEEVILPRQALSSLDRDLEAILLKALAKNPAERYGGAAELARDLENYLAGNPITARPATMGYLLSKWLRKRWLPVSVAATLALVLLGLAGWSYRSIAAARDVARDSEAKAQKALADFLAQQSALASATQAADRATVQARIAEGAREEANNRAQFALADTYTMRGLENNATNGVQALWLANAVAAASGESGDPARVESNLIRLKDLPSPWTPVACVEKGYDHLQFAPQDSRYLLSYRGYGEGEPAAQVWDLLTEKPLRYPADFAPPSAAAWVAEKRLLLGSAKGRVLLAQLPDLTTIKSWEMPGPVRCVASSTDGTKIAAAVGNRLLIWPAAGGNPEVIMHSDVIQYVAFGTQSSLLVTSTNQEARLFTVSLITPSTLQVSRDLPPMPHLYRSGTWSHAPLLLDGDKQLLTVDALGTSRTPGRYKWYDTTSGAVLATTADTETTTLRDMVAAPDGMSFLVASGMSYTYDVRQRKRLRTFGDVTDLVISPRGDLCITNDLVQQYNGGNLGSTAFPRLPHKGHLAISADGRLVACETSGLVEVLRVPTPVIRPNLTLRCTLPGRLSWVAFAPDNRHVAPIGILDGGGEVTAMQVYDATTGNTAGPRIALNGRLVAAAFSPDSRYIAAATGLGNDKRQVRVWDWAQGTPICALELEAEPSWVAFSPDGKALAAHSLDGDVKLIDPESGAQLLQVKAAARTGDYPWMAGPGTIRFSRDGKRFFTWGANTVQVWERNTSGKPRLEIAHQKGCFAVAESPDGKLLATVGYDNFLHLVNLETGQDVWPPMDHPDDLIDVRFNPDGNTLCTVCQDGQVRVFNLQTGGLRFAIAPGGSLCSAAYTPDGRWLATGGKTSYQLWDAKTGFAVSRSLPISGWRNQIDISADGQRLAISGSESSFQITDLTQLLHADPVVTQDLLLWSELISHARINGATLVSLSNTEWIERWNAYRKSHPRTSMGNLLNAP